MKVFSTSTGETVRKLHGTYGNVVRICVNPVNSLQVCSPIHMCDSFFQILALGAQGGLTVWDVSDGSRIRNLPISRKVDDICCSETTLYWSSVSERKESFRSSLFVYDLSTWQNNSISSLRGNYLAQYKLTKYSQ